MLEDTALYKNCILLLFFLFKKYSGPCILRPPSQPEKHDLKLKLVLKLRDNYIENINVFMSLMAGLKIEGNLNGGVLNHRDQCMKF